MDKRCCIVLIVLVILALFVIVAAWKFEFNENKLLEHKPTLSEVPEEGRKEYLKSLACFNYSEGVTWRRSAIGSIIGTALVAMYLCKTSCLTVERIIVIGFILMATMTTLSNFRAFHIDRVICQKAADDAPWFDDIRNRHPM